MKVGFRTPSLKRSFKARTTGRVKRAIRRSYNPLYGKSGMGFIKNPKRSVYNKVYHKTTFGCGDVGRWVTKSSGRRRSRSTGGIFNIIIAVIILGYFFPVIFFIAGTIILAVLGGHIYNAIQKHKSQNPQDSQDSQSPQD